MRPYSTFRSLFPLTVSATAAWLVGCAASPALERADDASSPTRARPVEAPRGNYAEAPAPLSEETAAPSVNPSMQYEAHESAPSVERSAPRASASDKAARSEAAPPASPSYRAESRSAGGAYKSSPSIVPERPRERPGLGTTWGETRTSYVSDVRFERQSRNTPSALFQFNYNDREGILAQTGENSFDAFAPNYARSPNGYVSVEIVDPNGNALLGLPRSDRTYLLGSDGDRYALRINNHDRFRYEVVATVDGLDVIDGTKASFGKRGYILDSYGSLLIEGFRRSSSAIAAFRFGSVKDSYAARTQTDRHVGVIGVAIFEERYHEPTYSDQEIRRRESADPFPGQFARPPVQRPREPLMQ